MQDKTKIKTARQAFLPCETLFLCLFSVGTALPPDLMYATIVYRVLYDLALDLFDRPNVSMTMLSMRSPSLSRQVSGEPQVDIFHCCC